LSDFSLAGARSARCLAPRLTHLFLTREPEQIVLHRSIDFALTCASLL
jgi:hypothetical protein